jgi:hypothetical protein
MPAAISPCNQITIGTGTAARPRGGRPIAALADVQHTMTAFGARPTRWFALRVRGPQKINEDPMLAILASLPVDDESVTADDRRHIDDGWQAYRNGQVVDARKFQGIEGYRLQDGDYRILYDIDKDNRQFVMFRVSDRKDAYRERLDC